MDAAVREMRAAPPLLTGGIYQTFRRITYRTTPPGETVTFDLGNITVVHYHASEEGICGGAGPAPGRAS